MSGSEASTDEPTHAGKLDRVATAFPDRPELPWMLASAAVLRAYKIISYRAVAVLDDVEELSISRYEVLGLLYGAPNGTLAVRELKEASFLHPPTLTYILDWLETRKLARRKGNRRDRRSVLVVITVRGRDLFERATTVLGEIHFGLKGLSDDQVRALYDSLGRLQHP